MFVPAEGNEVRADLPDLSPTQLQQLQGLLQGEGISARWAGSSIFVDAAYEDRVTSLVTQVRQAGPPPGATPTAPAAPTAQAGYGQPAAYGQPAGYGAPQPAGYGQPQPYGYAAAAPPNNSNATIALVCSILSWFVCPIILAIVGIVLGKKAQNEIATSGGTQGGEGLAKAAVIISWINIGFYVVFGLLYLLIVVLVVAGSSTT